MGNPNLLILDGLTHLSQTGKLYFSDSGKLILSNDISHEGISFTIEKNAIQDKNCITLITEKYPMVDRIHFVWDGEKYVSDDIEFYSSDDLKIAEEFPLG